MRTVFIALAFWSSLAWGEFPAQSNSSNPSMAPVLPVPRQRMLYPGGGNFYSPNTTQFNDEVFDLPEMREAPVQEYTKDGRPIVAQSPLNTEALAEIERTCREFRDKGQMESYRKCVREPKEKALAEIQSSYDRTNRTKERPFRKSDAAPPLMEEQRKANRAFDAQEND